MESSLRDRVPSGTQLIETFRWEPAQGFINLDRHLARMKRSAEALGFDYEDLWALYVIQARGAGPLRCRLTLGSDGFDFSTAPFVPLDKVWVLSFAAQRLDSGNAFLRHKTTQRALYDRARKNLPAGIDETIFLNERDEVCEGTITNLFITMPDGQGLTPPLSSGVLPGIQREIALEQGYREAIITLDMLDNAKAIHMGNSLRGMIAARLVSDQPAYI